MKCSKSPVVTELEYIEPLCTVFESGSTTIISLRALGEGAFDGLRDVDFVRPLLGADGVAVQRVDDGIAAVLVLRVARRQEDEDVAVDGVAFEIAFERSAVDLDVLDGDRLCAGDDCRDFGFDLSGKLCGENGAESNREESRTFSHGATDYRILSRCIT